MSPSHSNTIRKTLTKSLSEKFVWAIAYLTTCLVAFKVFKGRRLYRLISLVGAMFASGFLVLLLYPGSPASLTKSSYIALGVWGLIGMIFFAIRFKDLKNVTNEELDYLILNKQ